MLRSKSNYKDIFFFFSSRRRHTRLQGDWSSDVCSSDLAQLPFQHPLGARNLLFQRGAPTQHRFALIGEVPSRLLRTGRRSERSFASLAHLTDLQWLFHSFQKVWPMVQPAKPAHTLHAL